jgi:hypothetical protein
MTGLPFAKASTKIDSSKVALDSLPYFFTDDFSLHQRLDTGLNELHRYNPLFRTGNFYNVTGHITLPSRNVFYNPVVREGINFGNNAHDAIYLNNDAVQFMHTYYPITLVKAVIGSKKEQLVDLLHSQQITPQLNIGFRINGIRTAGYYNKQQSNTVAFQAFNSFIGKNGRYKSFFSYTYNRVVAQLNGGLQPDSANSFAYQSLTDKALIPVYLTNATHQLFGSDVYTKQVIGLDQKIKKSEFAALKDSSSSLYKISLEGRYHEYFRNYSDLFTDSNYYTNFYFSQAAFKDRIAAKKAKGQINVYNTLRGKAINNYVGYEVFAGAENMNVSMLSYRKNYFTFYIGGALAKNISILSLRAEGKYFFNGYNQENYQTIIGLQSNEKANLKWLLQAGANKMNTDIVNNYYTSNNFIWENNFKPLTQLFFNASVQHGSYGNLFLQYSSIGNYVFSDSLAHPKQLNTVISLLQLKYHKLFKFKAFRFAPEILFQQDGSAEQYMGLPKFFSKTSLFFEGRIFKKELKFQLGTDIFWISSYRPYSYMAATNQFYYQTKFNSGSLPLADVFLSFKIKTVQAFVRFEQLNTIFTAPYFFSAYQAMPGFTFKLGLNWMFIN